MAKPPKPKKPPKDTRDLEKEAAEAAARLRERERTRIGTAKTIRAGNIERPPLERRRLGAASQAILGA